MPLDDRSLDERFPLSLMLSAGLEASYRLSPGYSVAVAPTATYGTAVGRNRMAAHLTTTEFGASLRLRYDMRHRERRAVAPQDPARP